MSTRDHSSSVGVRRGTGSTSSAGTTTTPETPAPSIEMPGRASGSSESAVGRFRPIRRPLRRSHRFRPHRFRPHRLLRAVVSRVFFAAIGLDVIFVPFYGLVDGFYRVGSHCRGRGPSRNDGRTAEDDVVGPDHDGACSGVPCPETAVSPSAVYVSSTPAARIPIDAVFEVSVDGGRGRPAPR